MISVKLLKSRYRQEQNHSYILVDTPMIDYIMELEMGMETDEG